MFAASPPALLYKEATQPSDTSGGTTTGRPSSSPCSSGAVSQRLLPPGSAEKRFGQIWINQDLVFNKKTGIKIAHLNTLINSLWRFCRSCFVKNQIYIFGWWIHPFLRSHPGFWRPRQVPPPLFALVSSTGTRAGWSRERLRESQCIYNTRLIHRNVALFKNADKCFIWIKDWFSSWKGKNVCLYFYQINRFSNVWKTKLIGFCHIIIIQQRPTCSCYSFILVLW